MSDEPGTPAPHRPPGSAPSRPDTVVVVVGTGTEVGKTWVGAALLRALRARGVPVWARKPAQSFEPGTGPTDADLLGEASGEPPTVVCPRHRWYPVPMAPPMAAEALGLEPPRLGTLLDEVGWNPSATAGEPGGVGLVETAGGLRSPQARAELTEVHPGSAPGAADVDAVAVIEALRPDLVLLVADAGLGTIHAVRSTLTSMANWPLVVLLNRFDASSALHVANRDRLLVDPRGDGAAEGAGDPAHVPIVVTDVAAVVEAVLAVAGRPRA